MMTTEERERFWSTKQTHVASQLASQAEKKMPIEIFLMVPAVESLTVKLEDSLMYVKEMKWDENRNE